MEFRRWIAFLLFKCILIGYEMLLGHPTWDFLNPPFASASQDGKVIIWTVAKEGDQWEGKVLYDFKTPVWRVSWSLTGNILAVSDGNNNVTLWKEDVDGEWHQEAGD